MSSASRATRCGYRSGGTASDDACARWIAAEMRAIGLSDVALEAVPVDEWDFKSASVSVSGLGYSNPVTYRATGFGGGVSTPTAGVTGDVVYVKDVDLVNGPWSGSAGAFDAVGDVSGQDRGRRLRERHVVDEPAGHGGRPARRRRRHPHLQPGLAGVLRPARRPRAPSTPRPTSPPRRWSGSPGRTATPSRSALAVGAVTATVKLNAPLRLIADGGKGYNVVGKIKGSTNKNEYVVFGGHHDAWFQGGLDNASSVVNSLVIAKAMKMSHFTPKRDDGLPQHHRRGVRASPTAGTTGASAPGTSSP